MKRRRPAAPGRSPQRLAEAASPATQPAAAPDHSGARRQRQPKGRDHQFNVRLRRDTLDFIDAQANDRNIPVAQVIEEAMEALKRHPEN